MEQVAYEMVLQCAGNNRSKCSEASPIPGTAWGQGGVGNVHYAWYPWTMQETLAPGTYEVWSHAVDALGRSQPLDGSIDWHPNGYEWHGVHKIGVTVQ